MELQLRDARIWNDRNAWTKIASNLTAAQIAEEPASTLTLVGKYLVIRNPPDNHRGILFLQNVRKIFSGSPYKVMQPMPQFIMAMVMQQEGEKDDARKLYAVAEKMFDWNPNRATNADAWMFQVLRREAQQMIMPTTRPASAP